MQEAREVPHVVGDLTCLSIMGAFWVAFMSFSLHRVAVPAGRGSVLRS